MSDLVCLRKPLRRCRCIRQFTEPNGAVIDRCPRVDTIHSSRGVTTASESRKIAVYHGSVHIRETEAAAPTMEGYPVMVNVQQLKWRDTRGFLHHLSFKLGSRPERTAPGVN